MDMVTLAAAKSYTKKALDGIGSLQGKDGKSAYQTWLDNGNKGTEQDFLNSLKGTKGDKGDKGDQGIQGLKGNKGDKGEKGDTGTSIAHFWNDTTLTITSASGTSSANLKGEKGEKGDPGKDGTGVTILGNFNTEEDLYIAHPTGNVGDSYIVNGNLYVWNEEGLSWTNVGNIQGPKGEKGPQGNNGVDGKSAYQYAVENGFIGNEQEFAQYLSKIKSLDEKVKMFHAALDPVTTHYIKDSGDFTYADVLATENCKIEATYGNVTIIFNKEVVRNIQPDPVTGRYVEFSALLRNGPTTVKVFLFVYDPENLPTDPNSVAVLENWGDSQYCGIEVQHIVIGDFLDNDITTGRNNTLNAPSTKAAGDYVDSQCGMVLEYMQSTFAQNIMTLVANTYGPHIIYSDPTGFEASNDDAGDTWHLTGLNLSPYKRIKCYVCSGGDSDANYSPEHIVEVHLDDRAKGSFGYFTASHTGHNQNNRNRYHIATFTVNAEKTAIQFQHSISIYGTSASNSTGGRRCYLIEGYMV